MLDRNAIILAAGKSSRFAPFTYEKPKGLFCVRGEVLIERQIEQLRAAGIHEIYIVVGYMKEKFFYLEQKYSEVHLIVNNLFGKKGNLYSLYKAREYLSDTYICCADHYFLNNPFVEENTCNHSYRACAYIEGKFSEFAVDISDANIVTEMQVGGEDGFAMVGHAYLNKSFSNRFRKILESEIDDFGVGNMFWEEFYAKHIRELTFYAREFNIGEIIEFESIDDLRTFDSDFLLNVDSEIISNICNVLKCAPEEIADIDVINAGLTNVSFSFVVSGQKYVYRHPGGTADSLVDRKAELFAQMMAKDLAIDESIICMDLSGWKISYYVENAKNCDFDENSQHMMIAIDYLHRLHQASYDENVKIFDNVAEGRRLLQIASRTKGNLEKEFSELIDKVERLYHFVKEDAKKQGHGLVLCHNDVYAPNFLYDSSDRVFLIDWEYAGVNYGANDICTILCRYDMSEEQIKMYLEAYVGHELTEDERRFYHAFIPISGFYWFCWGLYKGSVGDDDSFFFLPSYRNTVRYIDKALESYGAL